MPELTVWRVWQGAGIVGAGALKQLGDGGCEPGWMRTHPHHLRRGVAASLLEHMIGTASGRGLRRLSLETGTGAAFEPAPALHRRRGLADGGAFSSHMRGSCNQFPHLSR